jgi:hypothetical protein
MQRSKRMNGKEKDWKPGVVDEHHGVGGSYTIVDGKRVPVEGSRTDMNPRVKINPATGERTLMTEAEIAAADAEANKE